MPPTGANGDVVDVWQTNHWNGWGDRTKKLTLSPTDREIVVHPSGKVLRKVIPFLYDKFDGFAVTGILDTPSLSLNEAIDRMPKPVVNTEFLSLLRQHLRPSQVDVDPEARLCHSVGKNYRDLWRIRRGIVERPPDVVVYPESHADCEFIMQTAVKTGVCLIPFGGGTNVVGAVEPDPSIKGCVCSVDMRRMNRMLKVDTKARMATFEAGVLGPELEKQLSQHGLMLGHDPDSFQHSTLGGWVATRSSGAASNKYGEMEEMCVSLKAVTPQGTVETPTNPRTVGPGLKEMFAGSEGILGIITEITIKAHAKPPVTHYEGWLVPSFQAGIDASQEVTRLDVRPAIFRIYDADETSLSFALAFDKGIVMENVSKLIKMYLQYVKRYSIEKLGMVIVGYEGTKQVVQTQRQKTKQVLASRGGFCVGPSGGATWQERKYDLPLMRDFLLDHGLWADVLETSIDYTKLMACWEDVKQSVHAVWQKKGKVGWIGCHSAHQYQVGACLYFTFASIQEDENDIGGTFLELKNAATEAILRHGGALTHHHGIGYEHVPWTQRYYGNGGLGVLHALKRHVDPRGLCNPGKVIPIEAGDVAGEEQNQKRREAMMFYRMGIPQGKL